MKLVHETLFSMNSVEETSRNSGGTSREYKIVGLSCYSVIARVYTYIYIYVFLKTKNTKIEPKN